ncbi:hypothetical protein PV325_012492 [Microctonus aethiopoides]|nr:hypothetical protein PV325_012492 [Microctonus aethiopoides]
MRWWTHRHQLYYILRQLSMQWETTRVQNFFTIENLKAAENAKNMRSIYIISVCIVFFSYILRPYIMYLNHSLHRNTNDSFDYYHTTVYPAVYPFAIETLGRFCVVVTYQQITATIACTYWVSSDTLFAQIMTHISIQFLVLANRLENGVADDDNFKNDDVIRQQLKNIAKQHRQLFHIGSVHMFLTFSSMNCSQQLATLDWSEALKYVSHLISLSIQTVIYCGYADRLTRSWTQWSTRNKMILMIIMMRAAKEYQCTSYGMITLSLKQVTTVLVNRLENIAADDDNFKNNDVIRQQLVNIAKQHRQLFQYCQLNEELYNPIIFLTVLSNGINLCSNLYLMEDVITQICRAAYYSQWTQWSKGNKVILMIIMMRAAEEYQWTSFGMISLNLKQVTTIANGAVSYFMLLRRFG